MDNRKTALYSHTFTDEISGAIFQEELMPNCITDYRCNSCHKLFFKGLLVEGTIEIKCRHCHELNTIHASTHNELLCLINPCPNRISWDSEKKTSS